MQEAEGNRREVYEFMKEIDRVNIVFYQEDENHEPEAIDLSNWGRFSRNQRAAFSTRRVGSMWSELQEEVVEEVP